MTPAEGVRPVARIDYRCEPYDWTFARAEAAAIDAHWAAVQAAKPALFDGRVLVAHRMAIEPDNGGVLRATGFETGYKPFLCWRDFGFPGEPLFNLFPMGALQSADGAFMLGAMSAGTTSAGRLYFPAGTPEPADVRADGTVDLAGNILRELQEETGLTPAEVDLDPDWLLVFDGARVACMKRVRCRLDTAALLRRFTEFRAEEREPELDALVPMRSTEDFQSDRMPGFMQTFLRRAFARPSLSP